MIQLQAMNYILEHNDVEFLLMFDERYYFTYNTEYKFIRDHYKKEKKLPDIVTVVDKCKDFKVIKVTETKKYLQDTLYEEYVSNESAKIINDSAKAYAKDAVKARAELVSKLQALKRPTMTYGTDIIANAKDRYDSLIDSMNSEEPSKFSTGLDELDMILGGGLRRGEELVLLYARTNNAKTWVAEEMAVSIWKQGYNVGFFEPEMSANSVGYRFDTLFKNFDNKGIMGDKDGFDTEPYRKYIETLTKKKRAKFNVTNPSDFTDKRVTVSALGEWVKNLDLKAIVVDGLTYLTNERGNGKKSVTDNLTEICEDLVSLSIECKIPIIIVLQANREGARDKDGEVNTEAPELDTVRGSDGISHNATRSISLYKAKDIIKLYLNKNRYGEKGQHLFYQYNVNEGKFTYVPNPKDGLGIDTTQNIAETYVDETSPF